MFNFLQVKYLIYEQGTLFDYTYKGFLFKFRKFVCPVMMGYPVGLLTMLYERNILKNCSDIFNFTEYMILCSKAKNVIQCFITCET